MRGVIDIREAMEPRPFKTPDAVIQAGLEYRNVPVGHGACQRLHVRPSDRKRARAGRQAGSVRTLLERQPGRGRSHSYFMLEQGLEEGRRRRSSYAGGLRSAELMEQALEYVQEPAGDLGSCQYILISVDLAVLRFAEIAPRASTQSPLRRRR